MQNATDPSIPTAAELVAADQQHRVMYVDGEMAAVDLRDRLRALGPIPASPEFILADLRKDSLPDIATEPGQAAFAKAFDAPPGLVVLDNLSSLAGHRTGEPDSWPKVQPFLLGLRCWVVHHTNKHGSLRGSAQHEDVLDLVIRCAAHRTTSRRRAPASNCTSRRPAPSPARRSSRSRRNCASTRRPGGLGLVADRAAG